MQLCIARPSCLGLGSAGNLPAPLGDSPSGTGEAPGCSWHIVWGKVVGLVPSGRLPDGTGESPVLPPLIGDCVGCYTCNAVTPTRHAE